MKRLIYLIIIFILLPTAVDAGALLTESNFEYLGSFKFPNGNLGGDETIGWTMGRGGKGITYNPARNSILISGNTQRNLVVEFSIPELVDISGVPDINIGIPMLHNAPVVQTPGNVAESSWSNLNLDGSTVTNGGVLGNFLVYNNKLIGNAWAYYAGLDSGYLSHFTASLNWATEGHQFSGFKRVGVNPTGGSSTSNAGWVGGYMCLVPSEWRDRLGAPALTGNGAAAIIERSSMGPSVWGFDPDTIGTEDIAPAEIFFGYPASHPTIGTYSTPGTLYYNLTTAFAGIVFPSGSDSILVFGKHGLSPDGLGSDCCYGTGTSDISLDGTPVPEYPNDRYCYDPANHDKGGHAYPYVPQVWAYNANDIADVRAGIKQYWEVVPYARWIVELPYAGGENLLGGVAYDPTTQRLFISQLGKDYVSNSYDAQPLIHVYHVNLDLVSDTIAPGSPSGLAVW